MNRALKIVEFAWIIIAVICLFEVIRLWGSGQVTLYYLGGFGIFAVIMFFVRRKQRLRYQANKAAKEKQEAS
jgi:hypothetical protein